MIGGGATVRGCKILIAEDEREIADLLRDYLEDHQFEALVSEDGEEALRLFRERSPQLAILDVMLPKLDGMEVCRAIRSESSIPIIMLSARKGETDKILGLGLGADDYVVKPFSPAEVVARVKAQLRRAHQLSSPSGPPDVLKFRDLELHPLSYEAKRGNRPIKLAAKEFEVLRFMALHPRQVLTREQIFEQVWGYDEYGDLNTVTVHIKRLREKLEDDPSAPVYIRTVWGVGYKFEGGLP